METHCFIGVIYGAQNDPRLMMMKMMKVKVKPLDTNIIVEYSYRFEPCHEKTKVLHMRKQRRRSASL